jgi:hypothetical protein
MPTSRECIQCHEPFESNSKLQKLCSPGCINARNAERRRMNLPERVCVTCGVTFKPLRDIQKNCSGECNAARNRETDKDVADTPQAAKLYSYYRERESIEITDRPDGTRVLITSDYQYPFVDEPLLGAVEEFIQDWKPNDLIYNGDILDCYSLSVFDKNPFRKFNLMTEIEMAADMLRRHKRLSGGRLWWIDGNHEQRVLRNMWRAGDAAWLMRDLPEAMGLDELTEGFVPYGKHIDYLGFIITHGNWVSQFSGYTARKHLEKYRSSGASGHTHRLGSYFATDSQYRGHAWYETGCMCRMDLEYNLSHPNWQHGFVIGRVYDGMLFPQTVPVISKQGQGRAFVVDGNVYRLDS